MAEFSLERDEFTHEALADGGIHSITVKGGAITISRFGMFSYYQVGTSYPAAYRWRVLAQPRSEIRLFFVSKGRNIHVRCDGETKVFSAGEANCSLVREGCTQEITLHGEGACELFMLVVGRLDVSLPIADSQPHLYDFLKADQCAWLLPGQNIQLGMRKITLIQQILHEKKPVYLQAAYTQVKLAELFVLFLEKADRFGEEEAVTLLRPDELARIRQVRNMLHDDPAAPYSLVGLAHAVGTNETTLKTHFKAVYGMTVFGYLTARRMELAKTLLLANNLKVSAVAQEVGYKYASHFSAAFRKYFGYLPTKLLRMLVSVPAYLSAGACPEVCTYLAIV